VGRDFHVGVQYGVVGGDQYGVVGGDQYEVGLYFGVVGVGYWYETGFGYVGVE
jgi:hypothetical protein